MTLLSNALLLCLFASNAIQLVVAKADLASVSSEITAYTVATAEPSDILLLEQMQLVLHEIVESRINGQQYCRVSIRLYQQVKTELRARGFTIIPDWDGLSFVYW